MNAYTSTSSAVQCVSVLIATLFIANASSAADHPMDALSSGEIERSVQILRDAGHLKEKAAVPMMSLIEMPKTEVLSWQPGDAIQRRAFVNVRQEQTVFEADVDLSNNAVLRWEKIPGVQTQQVFADIMTGQRAMATHEPWQMALAARGYEDLDDVSCFPVTPGYFNLADEKDRRVGRVYCYDKTFGSGNTFAHPVEGLYGLVDLDTGEVLDVIDTGIVPVSQDDHVYEEEKISTRPKLRPVRQDVPRGSNIALADNVVSWQNWSFHMRMERRDGLVLSLINYRDGEKDRSIAYQIHASEMFVPYMDASPGWYFRTFLDTGEYGFGATSTPLAEGVDCPADAIYRDVVFPNASGEAETSDTILCLFERNTGRPLWRHAADRNQVLESRPDVELVARHIPTIGNYDYVIDYVFTLHGNIRVDVGATGIDAVKGVAAQRADDPAAAADLATGELVAPGLVAVWHDHFLSFRVDLDVDGTANSLETAAITPRRLSSEEGPRRSLYGYEKSFTEREGAMAHSEHGQVWRVVNEGKKTELGHHPGIHVETGHQALSKLSADDYPQQRAAFTANPLWITQFDAMERYAGGAYPTQSQGGDGLPEYTRDAAPVRNEDVVVWVTMGFHHPTRVEDWPIMPAKWHHFTLRPFNFFSGNPSIDLPSQFRRGLF